MNLTELINECIRIKPGNKEFALFFDGESEWTAEIGNECQNIGLGEAPAEFSESGCSPEEAVSNLFEALRGVAEAADAIAASAAGGGMSDIDWSKAPKDYPIWIEALNGLESDWHRDAGDAYVDRFGREWTKPEEGFYVVHMPPAPWTGTGLPPVGTVCEYYWAADDSWRSGACVAHFDGRAVICDVDDEDCAERLDAHHVRPIRTPEQIAAEEREKAINEMVAQSPMLDKTWSRKVCQALYDAGYRKTEAP